MSTSKANHWCTESARNKASEIAGINGLYCGPTVVGWIAAIWNIDVKGRKYDYVKRLKSKTLFPDGPREFFGKPAVSPPGLPFQEGLNEILQRETEGDLKLSSETHYRYGTIHDKLEQYDMPIIIRMYPDTIGLHYVTLYKSRKKEVSPSLSNPLGLDQIMFYWQDNGLYGGMDQSNAGLYNTAWRDVGQSSFAFGSKRIVKT